MLTNEEILFEQYKLYCHPVGYICIPAGGNIIMSDDYAAA